MIIIPAIDIINGKAVRLTRGDFSQKKVYAADCLEVAKSFEDAGLKYLHLVDLDGAKNRKITNLNILEEIASQTSLKVDFGGGVSSRTDVSNILNAGAEQCTIGSLAVRHPERLSEWAEEFGTERFLIGADVQDERIKIGGWLEDGGILLFDFLRKISFLNIKQVFCTDISKDGLMSGPAVTLYKKIITGFPDLQIISSGGVSSLQHLRDLKESGCYGAIVGKAIYEKTISLKELAEFNAYVS